MIKCNLFPLGYWRSKLLILFVSQLPGNQHSVHAVHYYEILFFVFKCLFLEYIIFRNFFREFVRQVGGSEVMGVCIYI